MRAWAGGGAPRFLGDVTVVVNVLVVNVVVAVRAVVVARNVLVVVLFGEHMLAVVIIGIDIQSVTSQSSYPIHPASAILLVNLHCRGRGGIHQEAGAVGKQDL